MIKNPNDNVSQIADFVKKDTEAAFDILPEKDLRIRLEKRLKHELRNRPPQGLFRLKRSWAFAGTLTFILLVAIPLFILKDSAGEHTAHTAINNFLQGTPGVRTLKEWQQLNQRDSSGDSDTSEKLGRMTQERNIYRFLSRYSKHIEEEKNG